MMDWYDAELARFDFPFERLTVRTRFGNTHVLAAGSITAPPLMLVHGTNTSAVGWREQLRGLSSNYRVYAPDVIGMAGHSAPVRLPYDGPGYAQWLTGVLDGLGIERAALVGSSGGGHYVLKTAICAPRRVQSVVLINPCGITRFRYPYDFYRPALVANTIAWMSRFFARRSFARWLVSQQLPPNALPDDHTVQLAYLLLKHYRRYRPPGPLPARDLMSVEAPVLLLMSEHEPFFDPQMVIEVATRLLPHVTGCIVLNAGHDIHKDQPKDLNARVDAFLQQHEGVRA